MGDLGQGVYRRPRAEKIQPPGAYFGGVVGGLGEPSKASFPRSVGV